NRPDPLVPQDLPTAPAITPEPAPVRTVAARGGEQAIMPGTETAARPTFGQPRPAVEVPPQRTTSALDLQPQVLDTPAARREAATLAGQADLFAPQPEPPLAPAPRVEPTPIRPPARGTAELNPDDIVVDAANFQPRSQRYNRMGLTEASVDDIVGNFNPNKLDPIKVWRRPDDGRFVVLSGHHRLEAIKRLRAAGTPGAETIPATIVDGDLAEARRVARQSNSITTPNPSDYGRAIRAELDEGKNLRDAAAIHKVTAAQGQRYIDVSHLPEDLQALVDSRQIDLAPGARLGQAIREGVMSAADAQSFYRQRMLTRGYTRSQLDNILAGIAHRQQGAGLTQGTDMFAGLDLGAPQANAVFDQLERLGAELQTQKKLKTSLRTLAGSELAEPADSKRLQAVQERIDRLNEQLGQGPARGPAAISEAADAPVYATLFPGLPQLANAVRGAVRRAAEADAGDAARKYLPITEPNPQPTLTPEAQARLDRRFEAHPIHSGQTTREVWDALTERARVDLTEHRRLTGLGVTIPPRRGRRAPALTRDQQALRDIESAWSEHLPPGQSLAAVDPVELSGNRLRREVAIDVAGRLDVDPDQRPNFWQLLTRATTQTLIHSPGFSTSYTLLNLLGNPTNLALKAVRTGDTPTVRGAFTEIRPALARRGNLLGKGADPVGGLAKIEDELGLTVSPRYGSEVRYDVADATGAIREFLDKIYLGRIPIGRGKVSSVARPWENTARFNQELEGAQRRGAIAQRVTQRLSEALPDFRRVFDTEATRAGANPAAFTPMFDQLPLVFGAQRLYDQVLKTARAAGVS
ncbi:MAG: ParB N-terminal domain-containing protein, partial [Chloroflexota bacterium]|nr:ParB N-terminal domain-containing protein [Chloroflexota bacterium]